MRPRKLLLAATALVTLRCGNDLCDPCGFVASDGASDAAGEPVDAHGFLGFADAAPIDATFDGASDAADASDASDG